MTVRLSVRPSIRPTKMAPLWDIRLKPPEEIRTSNLFLSIIWAKRIWDPGVSEKFRVEESYVPAPWRWDAECAFWGLFRSILVVEANWMQVWLGNRVLWIDCEWSWSDSSTGKVSFSENEAETDLNWSQNGKNGLFRSILVVGGYWMQVWLGNRVFWIYCEWSWSD